MLLQTSQSAPLEYITSLLGMLEDESPSGLGTGLPGITQPGNMSSQGCWAVQGLSRFSSKRRETRVQHDSASVRERGSRACRRSLDVHARGRMAARAAK